MLYIHNWFCNFVYKQYVEPWHPKGAVSGIMALGSHVSESFLAYQLHSVVKMSGWEGGLEPGKC